MHKWKKSVSMIVVLFFLFTLVPVASLPGIGAQGQGQGIWLPEWSVAEAMSAGEIGFPAIAAGGSHTVALKNDGTVWAWGSNLSGQLGDGTTTGRTTPVQSLINLGEIDPPDEEGAFLTLPFTDPGVTIQQGWRYTAPIGPNPDDPYAHNGIDYIKGVLNQASTWQPFEVVAAAYGKAMHSSGGGYGDFVLIRHDNKDDQGRNYYTLYSHLGSIEDTITYRADRFSTDYENWTPVSRGQKIGMAGESGTNPGWIHLHFEVNRGGYAQNKVDPYDINNTRHYYPEGNNYSGIGPDSLWLYDPLDDIELSRDFEIGESVRVARTNGLGLRLRAEHNLTATILAVMPEGSAVTITGGPQSSGGYDWWQVSYGNMEGWAAGRYLVKEEGYTAPGDPTELGQLNIKGEAVPTGGEINENRILLKGNVSDPDGEQVRLQVEHRPVGTPFSHSTGDSPLVASGTEATITIAGLSSGSYHWRARTVSSSGMTSDWVYISQGTTSFTVDRKQMPTAIFSYDPLSPIEQETVSFDASNSVPKKDIVSYQWSSGSWSDNSGPKVSKSFPTGVHNVTLTVTTEDGFVDTYEQEIEIASKDLEKAVNTVIDRAKYDMQIILDNANEIAKATAYFGNSLDTLPDKVVVDSILQVVFSSLGIDQLKESRYITELFSEIGYDMTRIFVGEAARKTADALIDNYTSGNGTLQTSILELQVEEYINLLDETRDDILDELPYLDEGQLEVILDRLNRIRGGSIMLATHYRSNRIY